MFGNGLKAEIWRLIVLTGIALVTGLLIGFPSLCLAGGLLGYAVWLLVRVRRLEDWVNQARRGTLPAKEDLKGVWSDIAYDIQLMITKHEKEKQRLQTVVQRVQDMTTALTDGVILINRRGDMDWWNRAAEELFAFREVDRGHRLTNLIRHPKFIQYFETRKYDTPIAIELWRQDLHLEFQVHTFGEGERLVIARDITRLFKLEQMRKDFVANVSHELRTPLTVILGYVETLGDAPNVPSPLAKALDQMKTQCNRMTLLINDLLALTKLETENKESHRTMVPTQTLLESIAADARSLTQDKALHISIEGDSTANVFGSEPELRSAISNLVVNAINYSPKQANVIISVRALPNETIISVKDQGIGIDPKHIPRLTERFYRVDQGRSVASGGTGLGLAIVKHVLLRHNAELKIQSQPGKGSVFSCHFPVVTQSLQA